MTKSRWLPAPIDIALIAGIFALHAVLVGLFGEQIWAIRFVELLCVIALGIICARLVDRRARPGFVGFVCFTTFVFYYGYFSFCGHGTV